MDRSSLHDLKPLLRFVSMSHPHDAHLAALRRPPTREPAEGDAPPDPSAWDDKVRFRRVVHPRLGEFWVIEPVADLGGAVEGPCGWPSNPESQVRVSHVRDARYGRSARRRTQKRSS